jgi:short-subunit dehydrogenase
LKVAVVTGASSGIGEETARRLDRDGWTLVLVARREDRLSSLAGSLRDASYVAVDLTADDAPAAVRDAVEERHGGTIGLLVNNAGAAWRSTFADGGFENVRKTMDLNFDAQLRLTEALLPLLRASSPSAIVNVASVAGRVGRESSGAYSASKAALASWTDCLHLEEKPNGVHVGLVLPGFIATEGWPQSAIKSKPGGRLLVKTPDVVAGAIVSAAGGRAEVMVPGFPYRGVVVLRAFIPNIFMRLTGR